MISQLVDINQLRGLTLIVILGSYYSQEHPEALPDLFSVPVSSREGKHLTIDSQKLKSEAQLRAGIPLMINLSGLSRLLPGVRPRPFP